MALQEKARTDAEGARNTATLATRQAFLGAQSLNATMKALEAAEASSKLALDATTLGYKVGVKVNLDVLNAQSQLYGTQRDLAVARYNYLMSTLKLRQAAGTLTFNDLRPTRRRRPADASRTATAWTAPRRRRAATGRCWRTARATC